MPLATAMSSRQSIAIATLVEFLQQVQSTTDDIMQVVSFLIIQISADWYALSIPPSVQAGFKPIFLSKSTIDVTDLESLVSAIDRDGGAFCGRLNTAALIIFSNILRLSTECPSQERGYYMLAVCFPCQSLVIADLSQECLHENITPEHPPRKNLESKKKLLGARHIVTCFNRFLDVNRSDRARRAVRVCNQ